MLDINFIRQNPQKVKKVCKDKKIDPKIVDQVLDLDTKRRKAIKNLEDILALKNKTNKEIVKIKEKKEKEKIIFKMKDLSKKGDELKENLKKLEEKFVDLMYQVPNLVLEDVPVGLNEQDNKVIKKWGKIPKFDFKPKDHLALGEGLDIIDTKKAAKIAGSRFNYLKNQAVLLEFALIHFTFDLLTSQKIVKKIADTIEKGYSDKVFMPVIPPIMIRPDIFKKMARLSKTDKDEKYHLPKDDLYLIGSAEHTLGPLHMGEIIEEKNLPIRYLGFSTSLRREAGSYGKDTRGIFRVHQFDKIEMECFTLPETSLKEQNFIIALQEYLVQSLEIPYRVVMMCTGDMAAPDARQIDLECWMPGQGRYRETHTSDLMTDYQARRLGTRVRRKNGKLEFLHMNDATAFAIGRTLIAIFENYQQKDGSVKVPEVLKNYISFKIIKK